MTDWITTHRLPAAALALVVALGIALVITQRGSGPTDAGAAVATTTTILGASEGETTTTTTSTTVASDSPSVTDPDAGLATGLPDPATELPVEVTVDTGPVDAAGLATVSVHIAASSGSQIYGAEARICPADAEVRYDADFRPTQTGQCALGALRSGADDHLEVAGAPPYAALDLAFRTGSGSDTYATQSGSTVTVRCDADHPCSLVLKLQVPNAFGFRSYPIPFS